MTVPVPPPMRRASLFRRTLRFLVRLVRPQRAPLAGYRPTAQPAQYYTANPPAPPAMAAAAGNTDFSRRFAAQAVPIEPAMSSEELRAMEWTMPVEVRLSNLLSDGRGPTTRSLSGAYRDLAAPAPGGNDAGVDPAWSLRQGLDRIYENGPQALEAPWRHFTDDPLAEAGVSFVEQLATATGRPAGRIVVELAGDRTAGKDTLRRAAEFLVDSKGAGGHPNRAEAVNGVERALHDQLQVSLREHQASLRASLAQPDPLAGARTGRYLGAAAVQSTLDELANPSSALTAEQRQARQAALHTSHQLDPATRRSVNAERDPEQLGSLLGGEPPLAADPDRRADWVLANGLAKLQQDPRPSVPGGPQDPTVLAAQAFVHQLSDATGRGPGELVQRLTSVPQAQTLRTAAAIIQESSGLATDGPDGVRATSTIEAGMRRDRQAAIRRDTSELASIAVSPAAGQDVPTGARIGTAGITAARREIAGLRADRGMSPENEPQRSAQADPGPERSAYTSTAEQAIRAREQLDPARVSAPADRLADHQLRAGLDLIAQAGDPANLTGPDRDDPRMHAASGLVTTLADTTGQPRKTVVDQLTAPELPAGETLTKAAELLPASEGSATMGAQPGDTATEVQRLADAMRTEAGQRVQEADEAYSAVIRHPAGGHEMPTAARIGTSTVAAGHRELTAIGEDRLKTAAQAALHRGRDTRTAGHTSHTGAADLRHRHTRQGQATREV